MGGAEKKEKEQNLNVVHEVNAVAHCTSRYHELMFNDFHDG